MRLGIFGGTFDPVHYGHLLLAESCREQCQLDQVWLLPASAAPHKQSQATTDARHRVAMLELAVSGHPSIIVNTLEVDRGGVSYTFETLATIQEQHPDSQLFLLMGADTLDDLPNWREPARVCQLAVPTVVQRAGAPKPDYTVLSHLVDDDRLREFAKHRVCMPIVQLASSDIRERVRFGQSIRFRTPRAVEKYIESHSLYR